MASARKPAPRSGPQARARALAAKLKPMPLSERLRLVANYVDTGPSGSYEVAARVLETLVVELRGA